MTARRILARLLTKCESIGGCRLCHWSAIAPWLAQVRAPYKQGVWFEHSAHMIPWEEPGKTLVSLLEYVRPRTLERPAE